MLRYCDILQGAPILRQEIINNAIRDVLNEILIYVAHKANPMAINGPNIFRWFRCHLQHPGLQSSTLSESSPTKNSMFCQNYIKAVGPVSSFITVSIRSLSFVRRFGIGEVKRRTENVRLISTQFYDGLNFSLLFSIILFKRRSVEHNLRWFSLINFANWDRIESFILCYGPKNLND